MDLAFEETKSCFDISHCISAERGVFLFIFYAIYSKHSANKILYFCILLAFLLHLYSYWK